VDSVALERDVVFRYNYRPLARLLRRHSDDAATVNRIARAIIKEAGRLKVAPSLLTGVLLTENPQLEPATVSSQGAIGLMQVMHFHAGEFDCESDDLVDVESTSAARPVFSQLLRGPATCSALTAKPIARHTKLQSPLPGQGDRTASSTGSAGVSISSGDDPAIAARLPPRRACPFIPSPSSPVDHLENVPR
jgi:hypothetical protein